MSEKKGRHTTLGKDLKRSINWIERLPEVTKVIIGFSECCRHKYAPGQIKFRMDVNGGFTANGYSGKGVTDLFFKINPISERDRIKELIKKKFS